MVAAAKKLQPHVHHTPLLHNPWFAGADEGVTLHRYFDDQFVQKFVQEAVSSRLGATRSQSWYNGDRFGYSDLPTLRLPLHQTFYVACCEVSCNNVGQPAFDPKRIRSAGFVIRRRTAKGELQRWMVHEGQPLGWQNGLIPAQEPDDYRRFINSKLLQPQYPEPAYSGEETYPMHTLLVRSKEANGKTRSRTLLWGYVPLGGSYRVTSKSTQPPAEATNALRQELSWPFGERNAHKWTDQDSRPAFKGVATQALYEVLQLLLMRYRVFDSSDADNSELRKQLAEIHFHPPLVPHPPKPFDPYATPPANTKSETLLHWIENSCDSILQWLSNISTGKTAFPMPLPYQTGSSSDGSPISSYRNDDLYISEQQASKLRDTLLLRGGRAMMAIEEGLAMPRFAQSDDDRFFIQPFVRWQDECSCEKIHWGAQGSIDFRVVSPFDPEAQRPRAIILPGLKDIKRGSPKGVTMMVPKSLANLLLKIKPDMEMGGDGPGNTIGLCWNFSFSIPVITICAFILLMIVINLLNIILFWLPWAFLALPRLCGKLLSENK
jgi:hypothetical protein